MQSRSPNSYTEVYKTWYPKKNPIHKKVYYSVIDYCRIAITIAVSCNPVEEYNCLSFILRT